MNTTQERNRKAQARAQHDTWTQQEQARLTKLRKKLNKLRHIYELAQEPNCHGELYQLYELRLRLDHRMQRYPDLGPDLNPGHIALMMLFLLDYKLRKRDGHPYRAKHIAHDLGYGYASKNEFIAAMLLLGYRQDKRGNITHDDSKIVRRPIDGVRELVCKHGCTTPSHCPRCGGPAIPKRVARGSMSR